MEFLRVIAAQNAASSARSTLLGEAGWHRADLAEARTRDDGLKLWRCAGSHKLLPRGGRAVDYFFGHLHMVVSGHPFPGSVLFF